MHLNPLFRINHFRLRGHTDVKIRGKGSEARLITLRGDHCVKYDTMRAKLSNGHRETEWTDQPFTVHLCAEIDLEVLCIVKDVEEGTAFVKLGDAGGENSPQLAAMLIT